MTSSPTARHIRRRAAHADRGAATRAWELRELPRRASGGCNLAPGLTGEQR